MPNYDAGHYFLTALAPIRLDSLLIDGQSRSRRHLIRETLALMSARECVVTSTGNGEDKPFARNTRTHFARFVVLDDVVFNGKVSGDTLLSLGTDPLAAGPVDQLSTPFLIMAVDFDAENGAEDALTGYLAELWATMSDELVGIFQHCVGFDGNATARDFINYVKKCQIETTMPFNDYWSVPPNMPNLSLLPYILSGIGVIVLFAAAAFETGLPSLGFGAPVGLILIFLLVLRAIRRRADAPFPKSPPAAPAGDLPTVLKALYLQRGFVDLAIRVQGMGDQALYETFGSFLASYRPDLVAGPTQRPGVIG
jgi:hypothetical protein